MSLFTVNNWLNILPSFEQFSRFLFSAGKLDSVVFYESMHMFHMYGGHVLLFLSSLLREKKPVIKSDKSCDNGNNMIYQSPYYHPFGGEHFMKGIRYGRRRKNCM